MTEVAQMAARFRLDELLKRPPDEGGMSQSELARRSKISLVTINSIANNRTTQVKLDTLDRIAHVLGVAPGDLLERDKKRGKK